MSTPSAKPSFFAELQRRNVYRVGAMYAVAGWLLVQVVTQVFPIFDVSALVQRIIVLAIVAGFPVALVLSWIYELTPQGLVRTDDVVPDASITRHTGQQLNRAIIGFLLLAVLMLLARQFWPHTAPVAAEAGSAAPVVAANDKSIAVLPFANLSRDPDNAFFADGMQDEILTKLFKIGALRVISRTSTARYASSPENVGEIARQLGVANILEGSVQKAGNSVHINVQLISAAGDTHLWAESYNRTLDDMFGVEGEVAQAVAEALNARLSGAEQQAVAARPTSDPVAYELYLRARAASATTYSFSGALQDVDAFREVVKHDPGFALAWAQIALSMSVLYFDGLDQQRSTAAAVREAAETALRLAPQSAEALFAHAYYLYRVEHDYAGALEDFRLALEKQPKDPLILQGMFLVERRLGRWDDAIEHGRAAAALDPRDVSTISPLGCEGLNYLRRFDEARAVLNQARQVNPDEPNVLACLAQLEQVQNRLDAADALLARVPVDPHEVESLPRIHQYMYRRRFKDLSELLRQSLPSDDQALSGPDLQNLIYLGYAQKWSGQAPTARATFERAVRVLAASPDAMEHTEIVGYATLGLAYAGLGERDQALAAAAQGVEHNRTDAIKGAFSEIAQAQVQAQLGNTDAAIALLPHLLEVPAGLNPALLALDPVWDPLRADPRFRKLSGNADSPAPARP
jgi:TolB-like protein/Tfp pilus assembly protein PilF